MGAETPVSRSFPGWTIFMDENGNAGSGPGERSAVTRRDGNGRLRQRRCRGPSTACVRSPQAGWINTEPGTLPTAGDVPVEPGQQRSIEFGNFQLGTKSGMKFIDVDGDGKPYEQGVDTPKPGHVIVLMEETSRPRVSSCPARPTPTRWSRWSTRTRKGGTPSRRCSGR